MVIMGLSQQPSPFGGIMASTHLNLFVFAVSAIILSACGTTTVSGTKPATAVVGKDTITCILAAGANGYAGSCEVSCSVNALAVNFDGLDAKRACEGPKRTVSASLGKTAVANRWLGEMQGVKPEDPTRFELVPGVDNTSVARTPFGWFAVLKTKQSDSRLELTLNADRQVRPDKQDIAIINRAIALLPTSEVWNKNDNRQCPVGQAKLSLFCALMQATTEISGGIHYRQPALQAVREVVNTLPQERVKTHRIMDYNNHPATTLQEIHSLLRAAQALLEKDIR
jgi:hypothetical protein